MPAEGKRANRRPFSAGRSSRSARPSRGPGRKNAPPLQFLHHR